MRSFLGKSLILGVAIATTSIFGCSNSAKDGGAAASENGGTVGLALQVVPGVNLNSISYTITGNGVSLSGSLDVSGAGAGSSIIIGGIPAGTGYVIALDATSVDGNLHCTGSATFDVARGTTTAISPHLQCRKGQSGGVGISPVVNICPTVDSLAASPTSANVGSAIALTSVGNDDDHAPAALAYTWTAT